MTEAPIVTVRDLVKTFPVRGRAGEPKRTLRAVDNVGFDVLRGETLGLVGESGSGKSTTGRMLVGLISATSGTVELFGHHIAAGAEKGALNKVRSRLQFVFQDPQNSLNPRMRVGDAMIDGILRSLDGPIAELPYHACYAMLDSRWDFGKLIEKVKSLE